MSFHAEAAYGFHFATRRAWSHAPIRLNPMYEPSGSSEAETAAWLVRANAYTQSAMAELVRVRSIELANSGGQLKFSASHAATLHTAGNQVLQQGVQ